MTNKTLLDLLDGYCEQCPDDVWLRDRVGDEFTEWSWVDARSELTAVSAWLEQRYGNPANLALLSRNRAHWFLADLAIIGSGNVSVPLFTTLPGKTADYILKLTNAPALIVGETENWEAIQPLLDGSVDIITLPGVDLPVSHIRWEDIVAESEGQQASWQYRPDDLISIVFTSGTTGAPKGVMQSHDSFILPMVRARDIFNLRAHPRFLSYLPLSHIAERQLILVQSLLHGATVTFNESLATLLRDMADTRPNFFFGAPRVWEQLQQGILAKFGSQQTLDAALSANPEGVQAQIGGALGLDDADYLLTAAAPIPPALIDWFDRVGLCLLEGFGQTELIAVAANTAQDRRVGSIGRVPEGVELNITEEGELAFKATGSALGYYQMPEKTAETFRDGWVYTGDRGYVDDDGYVFLTGRVKDYFKTIHGKFVAPTPIENRFAKNEWTEQICLLGRGYSKTVMVCVLSEIANQQQRDELEKGLLALTDQVNQQIDKHARIGAVIVSRQPWTIANAMLTPTLKIRREEVEKRFGERAQVLASKSAMSGNLIADWVD